MSLWVKAGRNFSVERTGAMEVAALATHVDGVVSYYKLMRPRV